MIAVLRPRRCRQRRRAARGPRARGGARPRLHGAEPHRLERRDGRRRRWTAGRAACVRVRHDARRGRTHELHRARLRRAGVHGGEYSEEAGASYGGAVDLFLTASGAGFSRDGAVFKYAPTSGAARIEALATTRVEALAPATRTCSCAARGSARPRPTSPRGCSAASARRGHRRRRGSRTTRSSSSRRSRPLSRLVRSSPRGRPVAVAQGG